MNNIENPQLKLAYDFVSHTNKNIFLTGKAGTGKTTFLHHLRATSPKRMVVVAPTGVAAINAGGVTMHSFFQLSFAPYIPNQDEGAVKRFNREKINIIKSIDLLVIDEISMVRADVLDAVSDVLKRFRDKDKPFGGVQLLMIGDLHQLSPVIKDDEAGILRNYYPTNFFFGSRALQSSEYVCVELKHIYRQSDKIFIDLLNKVRENKIDKSVLADLNSRYIPSGIADKTGYITLTTHNSQAQQLNEVELNKLKSKSKIFTAEVKNDFPEFIYPTDFNLELKVGAQVMFMKNDASRDKLYYNGKIGTIIRIDDDVVYVKGEKDYAEIPVTTSEWHNVKYSIDEESKTVVETIIGKFIQIPLKTAWAITIHKSQGLTFEKAIIDANAAFAHGQVYVALSRCKTLEGMVLSSPLSTSAIKSSNEISSFNQQMSDNPPDEQVLVQAKINYQNDLVKELFAFNPLITNLYYLRKIIVENQNIIEADYVLQLDSMIATLKNEILPVAAKFSNELRNRMTENLDLEQNDNFQVRIKKGSEWFEQQIISVVEMPIRAMVFEIDNKEVQTQVKKALSIIHNGLKLKKSCFKSCINDGFTVQRYLQTRAEALLDETKEPTMLSEKSHTGKAPKGVNHAALYHTLKDWRNSKAIELDYDEYMILPQKTLIELSNELPTTTKALKKVKGIGEAKVKMFGEEILEIIKEYCSDKQIIVQEKDDTQEEIDLPKIEKVNTKQLSLNYYNNGMSIAEIAAVREMTIGTIETHLSHFIETGEVDIFKLMTKEKVEMISSSFIENQVSTLNEAKSILGDDVSYGEIRFVQKYLIKTQLQ